MSNRLEYKGYYTNIEIDFEANEFYGEIEGISDFVNFMSDVREGVQGIIREFHSAVDDYLDFCRAVDKVPEIIDEGAVMLA
jgi:predicted HicB family RNase H-like nuclease